MTSKLKAMILSDSAVGPLIGLLRKSGLDKGFELETLAGPFAAFENSDFFLSKNSEQCQILILLPCLPALRIKFRKSPENFAELEFERWKKNWSRSLALPGLRFVLQANFPDPEERWLGNNDHNEAESFTAAILKLNTLLSSAIGKQAQVRLVDLNLVAAWGGLEFWHENRFWITSRLPCSPDKMPLIANEIVRQLHNIFASPVKCIVTDFDETLWGGIVADDGWEKLLIDGSAMGEAYSDLQYLLIKLRKKGVIIASCSRNRQDVAKMVFDRHPGMKLKWDEINPKEFVSGNKHVALEKIRSELNISWQSIIFLDDDPYERDMARTLCPGLIVPDLPSDPADRVLYLLKSGLLGDPRLTEDDRVRPERMMVESQRKKLKSQFVSPDDYIKSLEMKATVKLNETINSERLVQLFERSNQYNLTGRKPLKSDLTDWLKKGQYLVEIELTDKFGHYGTIAGMMLSFTDKATIEAFAMSCRVASRGIEKMALWVATEIARKKSFQELFGIYRGNEKNITSQSLYLDSDFKKISETEGQIWKKDISDISINPLIEVTWN